MLGEFVAAGVDGVHPVEAPPSGDVTPAEFRRRVGRSLCFVGNLQLDDMLRSSGPEIERQIAALLAVFADWREGGFVLSVSGTPTCREPTAAAVGNYLAMLEAGVETVE